MANTEIDVKKTATAPQPYDPWRSFRNEMDRVFEQFSQSLAPLSFFRGAERVRLPSVDIAEDDKAFTITAELPGLTAQDVDVSLDGRTLVIKGEKQQEKKTEEKNYRLTERSYGAFERSFYLPDGVDTNGITANVANGVLTVTLPKQPEATEKAKKIEVKSA